MIVHFFWSSSFTTTWLTKMFPKLDIRGQNMLIMFLPHPKTSPFPPLWCESKTIKGRELTPPLTPIPHEFNLRLTAKKTLSPQYKFSHFPPASDINVHSFKLSKPFWDWITSEKESCWGVQNKLKYRWGQSGWMGGKINVHKVRRDREDFWCKERFKPAYIYIHSSDCLLLSYSQTFKVDFQSDGYHPIPTWLSYPCRLRVKWLNFQRILL